MTAPRSADLLVGVILVPPAALTATLACGGLLSAEPVAMAFGALFGAASLGIGCGAYRQIRSGLEAARDASATATALQHEAATGTLGHARARWDVDAASWERFWSVERRDRVAEGFGLWLGMTVLGGGMLALSREVSLAGAISFTAVFGAGLAALWFLWVTRASRATRRLVEVSDTTLYLGRMAHVFRSDRHRLEGARLLRDREPAALELTVSWPTRNGTQTEQIRAPVPPHRLDEVDALVAELLAHAGHDPDA
jgi:hypothetical protein